MRVDDNRGGSRPSKSNDVIYGWSTVVTVQQKCTALTAYNRALVFAWQLLECFEVLNVSTIHIITFFKSCQHWVYFLIRCAHSGKLEFCQWPFSCWFFVWLLFKFIVNFFSIYVFNVQICIAKVKQIKWKVP